MINDIIKWINSVHGIDIHNPKDLITIIESCPPPLHDSYFFDFLLGNLFGMLLTHKVSFENTDDEEYLQITSFISNFQKEVD